MTAKSAPKKTARSKGSSKSGKQSKPAYQKGMVVFIHPKGGLMFEASIGGQKFSFEPVM